MKWLIEPEALDEIQQAYSMDLSEIDASSIHGDSGVFSVGMDGTAQISVAGPLMARRSPVLDFFGVQHTGYDALGAALDVADRDPDVKRIQLNIDSPGGQVAGLFSVTDKIKGLKKPVSAVADYAASAAYAIAAATGRIEARGPASSFGSIGVVAEFAVKDDVVSITSTEAPDKRPDVKTEEGRAVIRAQLDDIHDLFVSAIADGRATSSEKVNENYGRGRVYLAQEALKRGMIDAVSSGNGSSGEQNEQSALAEESKNMDLKTLKAEHSEVFSEACSEAVAQERDRVNAHLISGEASGAMDTAIKAIKDGTAMTETLKAEYMAAGLKRRDIEARDTDDAEAGAALEGKATGEESDVTDFDRGFAQGLDSLRGISCD